MDETRRKILMKELQDAVRERDQLNVFIELLAVRLGISVSDTGASDATDEILPTANLSLPPAASINEGQFYGFSATRAAKVVLEMFGATRPMKTDELYDAITKGGVKIKDAGVLYRSIVRDDDFMRVGRGIWGLSEWYPTARRSTRPSQNGEPPNDERESSTGDDAPADSPEARDGEPD